RRIAAVLLALRLLASATPSWAQSDPNAISQIATGADQVAVTAPHGMVSSQDRLASTIRADILKRRGNPVDAAIAVGVALAVTLPKAGNIGGGGFMLVYLAERHRTIAIDYREAAPAATTAKVFLDANGNADPQKSRNSGLGVGVPGTVAGLALAHARYGS